MSTRTHNLLVTAALLIAAQADAGVHPPRSLEQVVGEADVGFVGRVIEKEEEVLEGGQMALTHVTFRIDELIFDDSGRAVGDRITLTFAGGRIGELQVAIAGVPTFELNEEALLFVRHDGRRYADPIIGGPQGRFQVIRASDSGRAFPLTAGGRGLRRIESNGTVRLERTERVAAIEGSTPRYAAADRDEHSHDQVHRMRITPTPIGTSGPAHLSADGEESPAAMRPTEIESLDAFVTLTRELAEARSSRR